MGKGKGMLERRVIRIAKNTILFEFFGISSYRLNYFVNKINKKLNFKAYLILKNDNFAKSFSKNNITFKYHNKYLLLD